MPSNDQPMQKPFRSKFGKTLSPTTQGFTRSIFPQNASYSTNELFVCKLYTTDVNISPQWVVSSIDKRIFLCDLEGQIRIFSYSRSLRRQPLLIEHFHLATMRLITTFTVTQDYLVAFESDIKTLTLHTHHGGILVRLIFLYDPIMIVRGDYHQKNQVWACSRTKQKCYRFPLDHTKKELIPVEECDLTERISNSFIDPLGISVDEQDRIAIHDVNPSTIDRLVLVANQHTIDITLDFVKYLDSLSTSRIERILLVPQQAHLIVIVYASKITITHVREIILLDINVQPAEILYRLSEVNGVQGIDVTSNGELVYTVPAQKNKRTPAKMHIYTLFN